jgi:hypothetical protein
MADGRWAGRKAVVAVALVVAMLAAPRQASAYSILAHEANIDALWDRVIRPLLLRQYPQTSAEGLREARAYTYGGSVIHDLGYHPFGSRFFSNLLHYVRTGDFVEALIRDARNVDEYAFALGALAHHAADNVGHPEAVNRAVALMFPKLRAKYGDVVTYVQAPAHHVSVEFSFDVVQVARGTYLPDAYHGFIGFQVAKPVLARAFQEIYALEMKDVFADEDLSISTFRKAVSEIVPELTRAAWREKNDEIRRLVPNVDENAFVFRFTRQQFEKEFGDRYQKPGLLARVAGLLYRLLPKIGPLKPLDFETPTPEAEQLFLQSLEDTRARYAASLDAVAHDRLELANTNFDTGRPSVLGEYKLADKTYAELRDRLDDRKVANVPADLRTDIAAFFGHQAAR